MQEVAAFAQWVQHIERNEHPVTRLLAINHLVSCVQKLSALPDHTELLRIVERIRILPAEEDTSGDCVDVEDESLPLIQDTNAVINACDLVHTMIKKAADEDTEAATEALEHLEMLDQIQLQLQLLQLLVELHRKGSELAHSLHAVQEVCSQFHQDNKTGGTNVSDVKQVATQLALEIDLHQSSRAAHQWSLLSLSEFLFVPLMSLTDCCWY